MLSIYLVIPLLLVLSSIIVIYNGLVRLNNLRQEAWSGIDVQLRRRYNLIPNLVETVKGYAAHEQSTLEAAISARTQCLQARQVPDQQNAENSFTGAIRGLFALAESYPDLKANENFTELQHQLIEIEDQLQMARRYYNGTVRNYNTRLESFPSVLIAGWFHFKPAEFFEIELATERSAPEVQLS